MERAIAKRLWMKEGKGNAAPESGPALYFYMLYTHFWQFLTVNLLFLLCCIPVVTIPAAFTALDRVCIKLVRERNVLFCLEFRDEFKRSFAKSLPLGLLFGSLLFVSYYLLSLGETNAANPFGVIFIGIGLCVLLLTVAWGAYAFVLQAAVELPFGTLLHNAFCLLFLGMRQSLAAICFVTGFAVAMLFLFPISLLFLVLGGIAFVQFSVCWFVNKPLQVHVIGPYEAKQAQNK